MIAGTAKRNENAKSCFFSTPRSNPVEIVVPERETPGKIAIACETPMIIDSFNFNGLLSGNFSEMNNKKAVNKKHIPIAVMFENKDSICDWKK